MFRGGIIDFDAEIDLAVGGIGDDGQEFVPGGKQFHAAVAAGNGGHVGHIGVLFHEPSAGQAVRGRGEGFGIKREEFLIVLFHAESSWIIDFGKTIPCFRYSAREKRRRKTFFET